MDDSENTVKRHFFVTQIIKQILKSLQWILQNYDLQFFYLPIVN